MDKARANEILDGVDQFGLSNWVQRGQLVEVVRFLVNALPDDKFEAALAETNAKHGGALKKLADQ